MPGTVISRVPVTESPFRVSEPEARDHPIRVGPATDAEPEMPEGVIVTLNDCVNDGVVPSLRLAVPTRLVLLKLRLMEVADQLRSFPEARLALPETDVGVKFRLAVALLPPGRSTLPEPVNDESVIVSFIVVKVHPIRVKSWVTVPEKDDGVMLNARTTLGPEGKETEALPDIFVVLSVSDEFVRLYPNSDRLCAAVAVKLVGEPLKLKAML